MIIIDTEDTEVKYWNKSSLTIRNLIDLKIEDQLIEFIIYLAINQLI
jgi:hypothetical protein